MACRQIECGFRDSGSRGGAGGGAGGGSRCARGVALGFKALDCFVCLDGRQRLKESSIRGELGLNRLAREGRKLRRSHGYRRKVRTSDCAMYYVLSDNKRRLCVSTCIIPIFLYMYRIGYSTTRTDRKKD